jgi:hypothetical protein
MNGGGSFMKRLATIESVEMTIRKEICANCRRRTPGLDGQLLCVKRPCETGCPVFLYVPELMRVGELVDPQVGNRRGVIRSYIAYELVPREAWEENAAALQNHAEALADILGRRQLV